MAGTFPGFYQRPLVMLAPLAGISDWPFRLLCGRLGADACVTEMISAQGYLSAPDDSRAYQEILESHPDEAPLTAQLFGHEPRYFEKALRRLTATGRYAGFDINMGCPAPKVCGSGSGSALMKKPELARDILRASRKATGLPLSVKIRLGWDEGSINALDFARMAQDEGLDFITLHGRTRQQQYSGKADWDAIARVRERVSIPVVANGDVFTWQDAREILRQTGCAGVAIGRGALGNPWIFRQIKQAFDGEELEETAPEEVLALALEHARMLAQWKGERHAVVEMRKHFAWYVKGMRGAAKLRQSINTLERLSDVEDALTAWFASQAD